MTTKSYNRLIIGSVVGVITLAIGAGFSVSLFLNGSIMWSWMWLMWGPGTVFMSLWAIYCMEKSEKKVKERYAKRHKREE